MATTDVEIKDEIVISVLVGSFFKRSSEQRGRD